MTALQTPAPGPGKFQTWLSREIRIFGREIPRRKWIGRLVVGTGLTFYLGLICVLVFNSIEIRILNNLPEDTIYGLLALGFILASFTVYFVTRIFISRVEVFIACTVGLAGVAFVGEKYFLGSIFYPPLTERTIYTLFIVFTALGVSTAFRYLPDIIHLFLTPLLTAGIFICIPFVISLSFLLLISWVLIPLGGLGLLTYAPLISILAFLAALWNIDRELDGRNSRKIQYLARGLSFLTALTICGYSLWFFSEWKELKERIDKTERVARAIVGSETNGLEKELPYEIRLASNLAPGHTLEYLLAYTPFKVLESMRNVTEFDALAYMAGLLYGGSSLNLEEKNKLSKTLFNKRHVAVERFWSGRDVITRNVKTRTSIYPSLRMALTQTTLEVYNRTSAAGPGEAIFTLSLPRGAVATNLSLWINGKEEPARLALKSQAKRAYKQIVGVESRDPALLEWVDQKHLRLRVFPVNPGKKRIVKFEIISPLEKGFNSEELEYRPPEIEGQPILGANHDLKVEVDAHRGPVFHHIDMEREKAEGGDLNINLETQKYSYSGSYEQNWRIRIPAVTPPEGKSRTFGEIYEISSLRKTLMETSVDAVYLMVTGELSGKEWLEVWKKLRVSLGSDIPITIVDRRFFNSHDPERVRKRLLEVEPPRFSLLPLYRLPADENALVIEAGSPFEIAYEDTVGSDYYKKSGVSFTKRRGRVLVASLKGRVSEYFRDLESLGQVVTLESETPEELYSLLKQGKLLVPVKDSDTVSIMSGKFSVSRRLLSHKGTGVPYIDNSNGGSRLIEALFLYNKILRLKSKGAPERETYRLARKGLMVSPVSSLIVLESEADYKRFGIENSNSGKSAGEFAEPGVAPEPEEWALFLLLFLIFAYRYRETLNPLFKRIQRVNILKNVGDFPGD